MDTKYFAKLLLFYICFYTGVASFFFGILILFFQTVDHNIPTYQTDQSLIGSSPGLTFRPVTESFKESKTLIWYNSESYIEWTSKLDYFLKIYRNELDERNLVYCSHYLFDRAPSKNNINCLFDIKRLKPCVSENYYNYNKKAPCVFLKLNKIYGWIPETYNDSKYLPNNMPEDLVEFIKYKEIASPLELNTVWISCDGETPSDKEYIGPIQYLPERGFPGYFFPYLNVPGYLSPLVAVYFEKPAIGILINIECKAWARNIIHDKIMSKGVARFQILID